jgi:hypothetical protein
MHRKHVSYYSQPLSLFPTTEGNMNLSNKKLYLASDTLKYIGNRGQRILNKTSQKLLKTNFLNFPSPNHPEYKNKIRSLNSFKLAVESLKDEGILNKEIDTENIKDRYVGSIISLNRLIEYTGSY